MNHHDHLLLVMLTKLALCVVPIVIFAIWETRKRSARSENYTPSRPAKRFSFIQLSGR